VLILRLVVVCATPLLLTAQSTSESPPSPPPFHPPSYRDRSAIKDDGSLSISIKSKSSKNALNACYK
jgi:hypothetical protein